MERSKILFSESILPKIEEKIMGIAQNLRWTLLISEGGSTDDVIEQEAQLNEKLKMTYKRIEEGAASK